MLAADQQMCLGSDVLKIHHTNILRLLHSLHLSLSSLFYTVVMLHWMYSYFSSAGQLQLLLVSTMLLCSLMQYKINSGMCQVMDNLI